MENAIPHRLATLGHPQRLAIFRLLVRRYPDRLPAGEIAQALGLKASTLSAYLAALMQAGLIMQERAGTSLKYSVDITQMRQTLDYMAFDCCKGRPDICGLVPLYSSRKDDPMPNRTFRVLFICTGNSARSIFAESLLRDLGGDRFAVYSAGTAPYSELNPFALAVLAANGHDTTSLRSKNIAEFQTPDTEPFDFVFTVCDQAANEECPAWPGQPITAHWGLPDPVKAEGNDAEKSLAFRRTYAALLQRVRAFSNLPVETLDRMALQTAADQIGQMPDGDAQ
jgi:arsenate reductase